MNLFISLSPSTLLLLALLLLTSLLPVSAQWTQGRSSSSSSSFALPPNLLGTYSEGEVIFVSLSEKFAMDGGGRGEEVKFQGLLGLPAGRKKEGIRTRCDSVA